MLRRQDVLLPPSPSVYDVYVCVPQVFKPQYTCTSKELFADELFMFLGGDGWNRTVLV